MLTYLKYKHEARLCEIVASPRVPLAGQPFNHTACHLLQLQTIEGCHSAPSMP